MTKLPRRPSEITDAAARRFWDKHAGPLWEDGTLTVRDVESFVVLCQVYGRLQQLSVLPPDPENFRASVQLNNAWKMYERYAVRFGLFGPKGRPERQESLQNTLDRLMSEDK